MLKTILKTSGLLACLLAMCGVANATGLGGIAVTSNLGQPLRAEIELVSVDKSDRASIAAKLASAEAFKTAGLDYPYALPKLKFDVVDRESRPRILITSLQPVNEPFVTLLVEVAWPSGKLLREYTFLLDPVGYNAPAQTPEVISPVAPLAVAEPVTAPVEPPMTAPLPAPVEIQAPSEAVPAAMETAPAASSPTATETVAASPVESEQAVPAESAPVAAMPVQDGLSREESIPLEEAANEPIKVVRGDTLSKIALANKPDDVSLERMLLALYRANTHAFVAKNMNRLQAGKILRLPDAAELDAVTQQEAKQEYRAQVRDWNAYRQQLAAARAQTVAEGAQQSASGKVTAAVAETAPTAKEPAKEVLKLSKGQAPGDQAAGGKSGGKEEDAIAREKSLRDAQERTALLEKNVKDLQRLAKLKQQQEKALAAPAPASAAAAGSGQGVVAAVKPSAKPAVPAPAPIAETSFIDDLLGDPVLLGGGVAVLLLLGAGGFWLSRRRTIKPAKTALAEDAGSATGRITTPVAPSPETGDFTQAADTEIAEEKSAEEVDPIAEADLFLSFGRDAQAEEVLKDALNTKPGDVPVTLKLLSIYANRKDANAFLTYARRVQESGDEATWKEVAAMGHELEPNNPLYGGTGEAAAAVAPANESVPESAVDFDLGFGDQSGNAALIGHQIKFETPTQESTTILTADEMRAAQETPMDFDVTGTRPPVSGTTAESAAAADDLIFDVTSLGRNAAAGEAKTAEASASAPKLDDLIFDITSTHPSLAAAGSGSANAAAATGADDLVFDVTATSPGMSAQDTQVIDKGEEPLAFTLDIPEQFKASAPSKTEAPLDIGLGDISLNMGETAGATKASAEGGRDERWQEVATKLDLAKAYQEMGDAAGAREILDEVVRDGDEQQRASAQAMLAQL